MKNMKCMIDLDAFNAKYEKSNQIKSDLQLHDQTFHGDTMGVVYGILDVKSDTFTFNKFNNEEQLRELMNTKGVITYYTTQLDKNKLCSRNFICVPYRDESSTKFLPDCLKQPVNCTVTIEVTLVYEENMTRTIVLKERTINVPVLELVQDSFEELEDIYRDEMALSDWSKSHGIAKDETELFQPFYDEDIDRTGIGIDYYNEIGMKHKIAHTTSQSIIDKIQSVRVIDVKYFH